MAAPTSPAQSITLHGMELLNTPLLNKGTAFTYEERSALGLHGLLPPIVETLEQQVARAYEAYLRKDEDLERHIYLRQLQDTNEVLFYRLLLDHIEEMVPLVYTPTIALGCQNFSHIYRRPRGLFISYPLRGSIPQLLRARPNRDVDVIVVTDGERILGIGDQGVGGMGVSIGKLSLYTLIGGIHPARTLPVLLDVGTNNEVALRDPEYLGWQHERITGAAYDEFIDRFVQAIRQEMPSTCIQWEDFSAVHARAILQRYRDRLLTFNDDIQGTAAVALGVVLSGLGVTRQTWMQQQVVVLGAGSAGIGVAEYLRDAMIAAGLSASEARSRFWILDINGLLHSGRNDLTPEQQLFAQDAGRVAGWTANARGHIGLAEVIRHVDATILIGLSAAAGAFTEPIVREMARKTPRPMVLPLSNPTSKAEARAEDIIRWSDGRALVATGSPSAPVDHNGRLLPIAQCNNAYIFPAVGLGLVASQATRVTDAMFQAAARALSQRAPALRDANAPLLPPLHDVRSVALEIAVAVGLAAQSSGVAPPLPEEELRLRVHSHHWSPAYPTLTTMPAGPPFRDSN